MADKFPQEDSSKPEEFTFNIAKDVEKASQNKSERAVSGIEISSGSEDEAMLQQEQQDLQDVRESLKPQIPWQTEAAIFNSPNVEKTMARAEKRPGFWRRLFGGKDN